MANELIFNCMHAGRRGPIKTLNSTYIARCLCVVPFLFTRLALASEWREITSDHFKLMTDASPASAAATLKRLEQTRQILSTLAVRQFGTDRLPVIAITGLSVLERFRTERMGGLYVNSSAGDLILLLGSG